MKAKMMSLADTTDAIPAFGHEDRPLIVLKMFVSGSLPKNGDIELAFTMTQASKLLAKVSAVVNEHIRKAEGEVP
jgi:glutaminase